MTLRRVTVIVLAIPYCAVMFPIWAVRDFAAAFGHGMRR
jgi:hypothetical protein